MNTFETYLINKGIHFQVAGRYGRILDKYLSWLKSQGLKPTQITKRSQFNKWLQHCREHGNGKRTIEIKENVIRKYYFFIGAKHNPAVSWIKNKREYTLPPSALTLEDLKKVYNALTPKSPADFRNRCMLGLVLFQGMTRSELQELRIQDIDFENGTVSIQRQLRSNGRVLQLESFQVIHLNSYLLKYRKNFLVSKKDKETDRFFLSQGCGDKLNNTLTFVLKKLKRDFPQIENLLHLRGSIITHWQKNDGIMEAMEKAGHRYISSTQRYQTDNYEELQEQLKTLHPLEQLNFSIS